jgi:prepilin-type N-terminal cleavage/methylation domain-containing protein
MSSVKSSKKDGVIDLKKGMNKNKGFTLVEILVSIAMIAIAIIAIIPLFNGSFSNIISSGQKSGAIAVAQKNIEDALENGTSLSTYTMNLTFKSAGYSDMVLTIPGQKVDVTYTYSNISGSLSVFVPKK